MLEDNSTAYADDFHVAWDLHKPADVENFRRQATKMFQAMQGYGPSVNFDKTVVILGAAGSKANKLLARLVITIPGKGKFLRLRANGQNVDIKVAKEHTHLGVKISYHKFEQATLAHRMQLAAASFNRLESVLRSKVIAPTKRIHLWKACVLSCLQHGLTSTGLQGNGCTRIRVFMTKHSRSILRKYSAWTRESNHDLYARFGLRDPVWTLVQSLDNRVHREDYVSNAMRNTKVTQWQQLVRASLHV